MAGSLTGVYKINMMKKAKKSGPDQGVTKRMKNGSQLGAKVVLDSRMSSYMLLVLTFRWIDACMRQLKYEGWIHHLARHSVACYITRGQCYISWERGMEVFDGTSFVKGRH